MLDYGFTFTNIVDRSVLLLLQMSVFVKTKISVTATLVVVNNVNHKT